MNFHARSIESGILYEKIEQAYPSSLLGHKGDLTSLNDPRTHSFGIVTSGKLQLSMGNDSFTLRAGMYFSLPGIGQIQGDGEAALFQRHGYRGLFSIGGPVEKSGRLTYIDHCTTTLICPPPRDGDPCLNLLSFPANLKQSAHIHPTIRLGAVISGSGHCVLASGRQALKPGVAFVIEPNLLHSFESGPDGLNVIAYHPDSEGGPTDESHPMLNRTYLK
jgi:quercetin dioxygenase-like cupin family protein